MADLATTVKNDLADYYVMIQKQLHTWVDPLSAEQIWKRPYPYGNSVGHLLHGVVADAAAIHVD